MDLQPGERVSFAGTGIELEFFAKSGRIARLCFITPKVVRIERRANESGPIQACNDLTKN